MGVAGQRFSGKPGNRLFRASGRVGCLGNDPGGSRYSPLTQITPENVWALKPAWTYNIGMIKNPPEFSSPTLEGTPILAESRLYVCSGGGRIAAIDPETGKEIWGAEPKSDNFSTYLLSCRGVTYARDAKVAEGELCAARSSPERSTAACSHSIPPPVKCARTGA